MTTGGLVSGLNTVSAAPVTVLLFGIHAVACRVAGVDGVDGKRNCRCRRHLTTHCPGRVRALRQRCKR